MESTDVAKNWKRFVVTMAFVLAPRLVLVTGFSPEEYLAPHNAARAAVGVAPLSWSAQLESYAMAYAQLQVSLNQCVPLRHSHGPFGENLFWGSVSGTGPGWTALDAVTVWSDEVEDYDWATNSCTPGKMCGHYTQVVWASTTQVGCASVLCRDNGGVIYIICSYNPPGNYIGQRPY